MEFNQLESSVRVAARRGELCKLLEASETNPQLQSCILRLATTKDSDGRTLLYDVVVGGNIGDCERVLGMRDESGSTASDLNMRDGGGWSPLMSACSSNKADVVVWLLGSGAKMDDKHRDVFYAASKGDARLMEVVANAAGLDDVTRLCIRGSTLLHRAVGAGNVEVVEWLVARMREQGKDVRVNVEEVKSGADETVMDVLRESWDGDERTKLERALGLGS